ncbi:MAG: hypothetical protein JXR80_00220 [Deltaproteobacteria bacterium]|nr:hypothetical protein [Deltaproteobacteria bacterium]
MLYIYDKKNKSFMDCKKTEFKTQGLLERQDLEEWVKKDPAMATLLQKTIETRAKNAGSA